MTKADTAAPTGPSRGSVPAVRVFGPSKVMTKLVLAAGVVVTIVEASVGNSGAAFLGGLTAVCALAWWSFRFPRLVLTEDELIVRETPFLEDGWQWRDLSPTTVVRHPGFALSDKAAQALGGGPVFYFLLSDNRSTGPQSPHLVLPLPRFVGYGKLRADACHEEVEAWRRRYGGNNTNEQPTGSKKALDRQINDDGVWPFLIIHFAFWALFIGLFVFLAMR